VIGAMLATTAATFCGLSPRLPGLGRNLGQFTLGMAVGLWFTPEAAAQAASHVGAMLAAAVCTLAVGCLLGLAHARLAGSDMTTALCSSVPGGPAEMAILARHYGAPGAPVAIAQTFRICALVLIIPPALTWSGITGRDLFAPVQAAFDPLGFAAMAAGCAAAAWLAVRLRVVNAWFLAPTAVVSALTASGVTLSAVPSALIVVAQIALGASLGAMFERRFLAEARRFLPATLIGTALLISGTTGIALLLAEATGLPAATLILSLAPGSVTEMAVTAKVLQLGVPLVTAFHLVRIFLVVLSTPWLLAALHWTARRLQTK
jgi:membrane AbrB-like protein